MKKVVLDVDTEDFAKGECLGHVVILEDVYKLVTDLIEVDISGIVVYLSGDTYYVTIS